MKFLLPPGRASQWLAGACDWAVIACGWWLIALSVVTCIEMLGRKLFGFSLQGVDEIGAYTYGLVGAFGFAYTLVTRSHTRVDFLLSRFAPRVRAWLNLGAMLSLAAVALLCVWRAWAVVQESVEMHSTAATPLATPMWIPQSLWLVGYGFFALVAMWASGYALWLMARGKIEALNHGFGPQTLEEEIASETEVQIAPGHSPAKAP